MTRDDIYNLLWRIANVSGYREDLIADPVAALAQVGITFDPSDVPSGGVTLPSNDDINKDLDPLTDAVVAGESHIHFLLQLGG